MKIKVQLYGSSSVPAAINATADFSEMGENWMQEKPLTFIAFSDTMKARILENFLKSPLKIGLSIFDGEAKTGAWHEPAIKTAIFNR